MIGSISRGDAAEVAALHRRRRCRRPAARCSATTHCHAGARGDRREAFRESAAAVGAAAGDRDVAEILQRIASGTAASASRSRSCTPFVGFEPEVRRRLAAAAERDEQVVGDVALGEADLRGARAIDVELVATAGSTTWWTRRSTMPGICASCARAASREPRGSPRCRGRRSARRSAPAGRN